VIQSPIRGEGHEASGVSRSWWSLGIGLLVHDQGEQDEGDQSVIGHASWVREVTKKSMPDSCMTRVPNSRVTVDFSFRYQTDLGLR
jgi:hypothetical protein